MYLTLKCKGGCHRVIHESVQPGFSVGPILRRHGWTMAPSGFYCVDCQGMIPIADFAKINQADEQAG